MSSSVEEVGGFVRKITVARVIDETQDARTLVFDIPPGTESSFAYRPGQFLTFRIPSEQTGSVARSYSLCTSPHLDGPLAVTVKRTPDGYGSNWLCDNASAGLSLHVLPPAGIFGPPNLDEDVLLCGAGSGITPLLSIIKSVLFAGTGRITLIYANRSERDVIFAETLRDLARERPDRLTVLHWLETVQGLPSTAQLSALINTLGMSERPSYLCGPAPFMDAIAGAIVASGGAESRIHREVFQSIDGDPFAPVAAVHANDASQEDGAVGVTVELEGTTHRLMWPREQTLLDTLLGAGIDAPFSCKEGSCSACVCSVRSGRVTMLANDVLEDDEVAAGQVLACQALPSTDEVEIYYVD